MSNPLLLCSTCFIMNLNNYECTSCGHLSCSKCVNDPFCIHCKRKSEYKKSLLSERIISKQQTSCHYCSMKMPFGDLSDHKVICPFMVFTCTKQGCSFNGNKQDFINHIKTNHDNQLIKAYDAKFNPMISNPIKNKGATMSRSGVFSENQIPFNNFNSNFEYPDLDDLQLNNEKPVDNYEQSNPNTKKDCIIY